MLPALHFTYRSLLCPVPFLPLYLSKRHKKPILWSFAMKIFVQLYLAPLSTRQTSSYPTSLPQNIDEIYCCRPKSISAFASFLHFPLMCLYLYTLDFFFLLAFLLRPKCLMKMFDRPFCIKIFEITFPSSVVWLLISLGILSWYTVTRICVFKSFKMEQFLFLTFTMSIVFSSSV